MAMIKGQGRPEGDWYGFAETVIEVVFAAKSPEAIAQYVVLKMSAFMYANESQWENCMS